MSKKKNILGLLPHLNEAEKTWVRVVLCRYSEESPVYNGSIWDLNLIDIALVDVGILYRGLLATMKIPPIKSEEISLKAKIEAYRANKKPAKNPKASRRLA